MKCERIFYKREKRMFESFSDFFWTFMAMSGFMFWVCLVIFLGMVIKRNRAKRKTYYE